MRRLGSAIDLVKVSGWRRGVGADVAEEDGVVPLELVAGAGEAFVGEVVGEVLDVEAAGFQGGG